MRYCTSPRDQRFNFQADFAVKPHHRFCDIKLFTTGRLLICDCGLQLAQKKEDTVLPNILSAEKNMLYVYVHVIYCIIVLTGNTGCYPDALDPELMSALQNVSEVVCRFVDNNPTAWAPLICQVLFTCYYGYVVIAYTVCTKCYFSALCGYFC